MPAMIDRFDHLFVQPSSAEDKSKTHGINGTRPTLHLRVDNVDERYAALAAYGNLIAFEQDADAR
jgi:hypothetical protein